jgi:hypothetical protein
VGSFTAGQDTSPDQEHDANQVRQINRALGEAQSPEMVEHHRRKHLAGDRAADRRATSRLVSSAF